MNLSDTDQAPYSAPAPQTATVSDEAVQAAELSYCRTMDATDDFSQSMRLALTAAAPYLTASVEVGELEWKHYDGTYPTWRARGHCCEFEAVIDKSLPLMYGDFPLRINGFMSKEKFTTIEQAQAAAQDVYRKRKLCGLIFKPVDAAAVREKLYREAYEDAVTDALNICDKFDDISLAEVESGIKSLQPDPKIIRALSPAEPVDQWQDIATAPKDGTVVDLWSAEFGRQSDCYWGKPEHHCGEAGQYCDSEWHGDPETWICSATNHTTFDDNTHWMPLPVTPTSKVGE